MRVPLKHASHRRAQGELKNGVTAREKRQSYASTEMALMTNTRRTKQTHYNVIKIARIILSLMKTLKASGRVIVRTITTRNAAQHSSVRKDKRHTNAMTES
jgi:hypothetical protein